MNDYQYHQLRNFASLEWYDEVVKFIFTFVTKTSELLLAAGIIVSTANFLTDGDVMRGHKFLSDAWSWSQALAIDSSLGIVFMNAFQAVRERDKTKAIIYFVLTALLATVAGLITHFDALSHAAGLPVTDRGVSGILPLWVMTALRSVAVIGFLLASRLKNISFNRFHQDWTEVTTISQEQPQSQGFGVAPQIDYTALASALVAAMQQAGVLQNMGDVEQDQASLPFPKSESSMISQQELETIEDASSDAKIAQSYNEIRAERATQQNNKVISARELAKRANVRRSTCSEWLQKHEGTQEDTMNDSSTDEVMPSIAQNQEQSALP